VLPWATPSARDFKDTTGMSTTGTNPDGSERNRLDQLPRQAALAGWQTPQAFDSGLGREGRLKKDCNRDPMKQGSYRADLKDEVLRTVIGLVQIGSTVLTLTVPNGAQLNPAHSLWLIGLPDVWLSCGERAMRSVRGRRKHSSKVT
jgi:hypothetical protein